MKNILVTGGSGYFGRAFVRRALELGAERVCVYSRNEYNQFLMRQQFNDDSRLRWFIGDVRDKDRLRWAMQGVDTVVHAAALKRIEVGFFNPVEMVKTNVLGAVNVIEAAMDAKPEKVLCLSSDKAFQPVSAYGHSKAMAETLFLAANHTTPADGPKFACVRYGNVSGSTGSVVPIWRQMKAEGRTKVPVSDPEVTRFWMMLDEAVDLVMMTLNSMEGGEMNIPLDLPAYRLGDLAKAMDLEMEITGLGEYEKLHESMAPNCSSDKAQRLSIKQLRRLLENV